MQSENPPNSVIVTEQALDREAVSALVARRIPVILQRCNLEGADLSRQSFAGWTFDSCRLSRATFTGAKLIETRWSGCRGPFADFTGADLSESEITGCDFNNGGFRGVTLTSSSLKRCKLTGANFAEARTLGCDFEEIIFADARLPGFSFPPETTRLQRRRCFPL